MLLNLGNPPVDEVAERTGPDHAVAEEEDICVFVAQWPEAIQLVLNEAKFGNRETRLTCLLSG